MIKFENSISIDRPIEQVFKFIANFENTPKWNYYVLDVEQLNPGTIREGTKFHQIRKSDEQTYQIIKYNPNHLVTIKTTPDSSPQFVMKFSLQSENGATVVKDEWQLETGQPALLERLAAWKIKSAVAENLNKLKQLLEAGKVTLQDGRTAHL